MPATYIQIASNILSTNTATITFSSIPNTYTDLLLKISARTASNADYDPLYLDFNNDTASNYSVQNLRGSGTFAEAFRLSNTNPITNGYAINGSTSTANTFANCEIYIPSYLTATNKPLNIFTAQETAATGANVVQQAALWRNNAAITSIRMYSNGSFVTNSSFFLYGIKNS